MASSKKGKRKARSPSPATGPSREKRKKADKASEAGQSASTVVTVTDSQSLVPVIEPYNAQNFYYKYLKTHTPDDPIYKDAIRYLVELRLDFDGQGFANSIVSSASAHGVEPQHLPVIQPIVEEELSFKFARLLMPLIDSPSRLTAMIHYLGRLAADPTRFRHGFTFHEALNNFVSENVLDDSASSMPIKEETISGRSVAENTPESNTEEDDMASGQTAEAIGEHMDVDVDSSDDEDDSEDEDEDEDESESEEAQADVLLQGTYTSSEAEESSSEEEDFHADAENRKNEYNIAIKAESPRVEGKPTLHQHRWPLSAEECDGFVCSCRPRRECEYDHRLSTAMRSNRHISTTPVLDLVVGLKDDISPERYRELRGSIIAELQRRAFAIPCHQLRTKLSNRGKLYSIDIMGRSKLWSTISGTVKGFKIGPVARRQVLERILQRFFQANRCLFPELVTCDIPQQGTGIIA